MGCGLRTTFAVVMLTYATGCSYVISRLTANDTLDPTPADPSGPDGSPSPPPASTPASTLTGGELDGGPLTERPDAMPGPPPPSPCDRPVPGDSIRFLTWNGIPRTYRIFASSAATAAPHTRAPLVVALHDGQSTSIAFRGASSLPETATTPYLFVFPDALEWNAGECCGVAPRLDDIGFITALVAQVQRDACVDSKRVYATGHGSGGALAVRLACEHPRDFAAVAFVASGQALSQSACAPSARVPMLSLYGSRDPMLPAPNATTGDFSGRMTGVRHPQDSILFWAGYNGCATDQTTRVFTAGLSDCEGASRCPSGTEVQSCFVEGGGHEWPTANPTNANAVNASARIIEFFSKHARP